MKRQAILYLIGAVLFAVCATANGLKEYCSTFFEAIVIFVFSSFGALLGTYSGFVVRSILGDFMFFANGVLDLFVKRIFFSIGFQFIGYLLGGFIGYSIATGMFDYYDPIYKGDFSEKILDRRDIEGKPFKLKANYNDDTGMPKGRYFEERKRRNPEKTYSSTSSENIIPDVLSPSRDSNDSYQAIIVDSSKEKICEQKLISEKVIKGVIESVFIEYNTAYMRIINENNENVILPFAYGDYTTYEALVGKHAVVYADVMQGEDPDGDCVVETWIQKVSLM